MRKLDGLEVVRGLAALLVLLNHLVAHTEGLYAPPPIKLLANYATEAVIVFFVLSGAVITLSHERKKSGFREYAKNRLIRILPIYLVSIAISVIAIYVRGDLLDPNQLVGNILFLQTIPGYLASPIPTNMSLWSLSYEMFFYFIIFTPIMIYPRSRWLFLVASISVGIAGYFYRTEEPALSHLLSMLQYTFFWLVGHYAVVYRQQLTPFGIGRGIAYLFLGIVYSRVLFGVNFGYYDFFRLAGFSMCAGILVFEVLQRSDEEPHRSAGLVAADRVVLAFFSIVAATGLWILSGSDIRTKWILTFVALTVCIIPYSFFSGAILGLHRLASGLVFLGSISYSLYVIHQPIILIVNEVVDGAWWQRMATVLAFVFLISCFLELRLQPLIRKQFSRPPQGTAQ